MVLPWAIYLLGLRPVFARNRLLVYNVLKCYLAVFAPAITRNRLLVYNVLQNRLACILSAKNALVDGADGANSVPSYAMRYRDEGASLLFEQRTQEIKQHREGNDYLLCGKKVAQICCK